MPTPPLILALAYVLDLGLGDPRWFPHPVRGLGWAIQRGEVLLRNCIRDEIWAGRILVLVIAVGTFGIVEGLLGFCARHSLWLLRAAEVTLLYTCLSTRDLAVESWPVYRGLRAGDLPRARSHLAMIVGRDTGDLPEPEIVRGTVETIGESAMDGIVAPLFYAAIGGVPLACLYKAVNTLDSMVGYRSARYLQFGRAAAKIDSWMNLIPARITALLIALASPIGGGSGFQSLKISFRDGWRRGENSFIPEAALAGALGIRLGGINCYQGKEVPVPFLGDPVQPLKPDRIPQSIRIMYGASLLAGGAAILVRWGVAQWIR